MLQLFYSNPNRSFYVREITRKIDEQINSVRRELSNLLSIGIISSDAKDNNRLYYEVNQSFEYYDPLRQIFGGASAKATSSAKVPTGDAQAHDFKSLGNVELVVYTGQFTRDETGGIDILIVGDINQTQLTKFIEELESKESKELRYVSMPVKEFVYRRQINDRFLSMVLSSKKQVLVDKRNVLTPVKSKKTESEEE